MLFGLFRIAYSAKARAKAMSSWVLVGWVIFCFVWIVFPLVFLV